MMRQSFPRVMAVRLPRFLFRVSLVLAILVVAGGVSLYEAKRFFPRTAVLPGLRLDGEAIAGGFTEKAAREVLERHARERESRHVHFTFDGKPVADLPVSALGITVDRQTVLNEVLTTGHTGDRLGRARRAEAAQNGAIDVPLPLTVDAAVGIAALSPLKEQLDVAPVSVKLDLDAHGVTPEIPGHYLDLDKAVALASEYAAESSNLAPADRTFEIPVMEVAPHMTTDFVRSLDVSTVVSTYQTYFSRGGEQMRRGKNIDNAAHKLNGLIMSPGQLVSFNEVVGERSEANGFERSWEIFKGEMVEGIGGGTCQVASTFHAAVFFAGMDVLERLPHSRPSAYIPMGLDSTVVYPSVDLKVRNPFDFPIVVHAVTAGNMLKIELLGSRRPAKVGFHREILATIPYKRKLDIDERLHGTKVVVKQHGIKGYQMRRERELQYADGTRKVEVTKDTYPATTEIYEVPDGFDEALLPELPGDEEDTDGASAVAASGTPASGNDAAKVACRDNCTDTSGVELIEGRGAHKPTAAQRSPARIMSLRQ